MPKRNVNISNRENPYNTYNGQDAVSITESFGARLWKEGRSRSSYFDSALSNTAGTVTNYGTVSSIGCRLYIFNVSLSSDVDAILMTQTTQGLATGDGDTLRFCYVYAKAGTPVILNFNGEVSIAENSAFNVVAIPLTNNSGGKIYASVHGIEIAEDTV